MSILSYLVNTDLPNVQGGAGETQTSSTQGTGPPPLLTGPPTSMGHDYIVLDNRVTEAKDQCGKVENMFIQEREERRVAITDLWNKLREVQKEVRDAKQLAYMKPQQDVSNFRMNQGVPQHAEAIMQHSVEVTRLERELADWKNQMQSSVQELWAHVRHPSFAAGGESSGGASVKNLRRDMDNLQKMVMELQLNVSMAAIRASRIAMRTSELSDRGKKEAIAVLEAKEQAITKQMEASRKERGVTTTYDADMMQSLQDFPARRQTSPRAEDNPPPVTTIPQAGTTTAVDPQS